jgi:gliding motility-associated-like protein
MGGGEGEAISYEFTIPADRNVYSLLYYYAVVFQDPNHQIYEQPRMEIEITNLTDNRPIECASFSFIPFGTGLPGFFQSSNQIDNTPIWCKDWSPVSINLDGNAGKTIRLLFRTGDCTFRRHFGYAYIDVDTDCSGEFVGASFCPLDPEISVTAPSGFQNYLWQNTARTQTLGTGQSLTLRPPPPSGTSVVVELTPYPGFGCKQTLTARLINNLNFTADAGNDTLSCNLAPVRIGGPSRPGLEYAWSPGESLSNPATANPIAIPKANTFYVLNVRSPGGGCTDSDTVFVRASNLANSLVIEGKAEYCIGSGDSAVLLVEDVNTIQWFKNNQPIAGEVGTRLLAPETGGYYAYLEDEYGCNANTRVAEVNISSIPVADFLVNNSAQCLAGNRFVFTNASTNEIGTMGYQWVLESNPIFQTPDATLVFTQAGNYDLNLIVRTNEICMDSAKVLLQVYPNPVPDFEAGYICVGLPYLPKNNTNGNIGSPIQYNWRYSTGQVFNEREPAAVVFNDPGSVSITLSASSEQCPLPVQTMTKVLNIQETAPSRRYLPAFAIQDSPLKLEARKIGVSALWEPAMQLNPATSYNPVFRGNTDREYTITLTTEGGCITVDTLLVMIVERAEIYVPTGFTPNGDGLNDELRPVLMGVNELRYFRVFNRWGQMVYETRTDKQGWNGMLKGQPQSTQTFTWMAEGVGVDGSLIKRKGTALLVR